MSCYALVKIGQKAQHGYTKVSPEDYVWLMEIKRTVSWSGSGYAFIGAWYGANKHAQLHRLILGRVLGRPLQPTEVVDHINGDTRDNRRENLRACSQAENLWNQKRSKNNTSGYKGVRRSGRAWSVSVMANGVQHYIGTYSTPELAHRKYQKAIKEIHGEFAPNGEVARGA